MTRYYAIKRLTDDKYYNYLYKDFMCLHQNTKLYKTVGTAESQFEQCLRKIYFEHIGRYASDYDNINEFLLDNIKDLKAVVMELREV